MGEIRESSRSQLLRIMDELKAQGAQAVILGCTEIGLLVPADTCPLPAFDTSLIHALAAAEAALSE